MRVEIAAKVRQGGPDVRNAPGAVPLLPLAARRHIQQDELARRCGRGEPLHARECLRAGRAHAGAGDVQRPALVDPARLGAVRTLHGTIRRLRPRQEGRVRRERRSGRRWRRRRGDVPRADVEIDARDGTAVRAAVRAGAAFQPSVGVEPAATRVGGALLLQRRDVAGHGRGVASAAELAARSVGAAAERLAGAVGAAALLGVAQVAVRVLNLGVRHRSLRVAVVQCGTLRLPPLVDSPAGAVPNCRQQRASEDIRGKVRCESYSCWCSQKASICQA